MSREYFERQMRVGRRVIFQWDHIARFGEICADCYPPDGSGKVVEGFTFVDEQRAEAFDLDFLESKVHDDCSEPLTRFDSWDDAEAWVFGRCGHVVDGIQP